MRKENKYINNNKDIEMFKILKRIDKMETASDRVSRKKFEKKVNWQWNPKFICKGLFY